MQWFDQETASWGVCVGLKFEPFGPVCTIQSVPFKLYRFILNKNIFGVLITCAFVFAGTRCVQDLISRIPSWKQYQYTPCG